MVVAHELPEANISILTQLTSLVDDIWQVKTLTGLNNKLPYPLYKMFGPLATGEEKELGEEFFGRTLSELQDAVGGDLVELSRQSALLYFRSWGWIEEFFNYALPEKERLLSIAKGEIILTVLHNWIRLHPSFATRALLSERITTLLGSSGAKRKPDLFRPTLLDCLDLLFNDESEDATRLLHQLILGYLGRAQEGKVEEPEMRKALPNILWRVHQADMLDYHDYKRAMQALPGAFQELTLPLESLPKAYRDLPPAFLLILESFNQRLLTELAENLPTGKTEAASLLKRTSYLEGATWLLLACAYVEEKKLKQLPGLRSKKPEAAATRLCICERGLLGLEDDKATVEFLRQYSKTTLQAVLPHTTAYKDLVEKALDSLG